MTMLTLNQTTRAHNAAAVICEHCHESHRGVIRYSPADTANKFCIALFGNDGYTEQPDSDSVIYARTKAYVHNLYAGLANLLPEGDVEFGTDQDGSTWVILAHFPRHEDHDDYQAEDEDADALVDFWSKIVWEQWKSQLAVTQE
jgi:hypothetical protein